jgi:hypothetical protein
MRSLVTAPLACLLPVVAAPRTVRGNPIPGRVLFTHVQPVGTSFCAGLPISSCAQIQQRTAAMGELEFDLFLWQQESDPYLPCDSLLITVRWPASWFFVSDDVCGASSSTFTHGSGGGVLRVPSLEGSPPSLRRGLLRVVLDVASPGWFEVLDVAGCHPYTTSVRAGLECGNCAWPCSRGSFGLYGPYFPEPDPAELELRAEAGQVATGHIDFRFEGEWPGETYEVVESEPWLTLDAQLEPPQYPGRGYKYSVAVSADAGSLAPGTREGWVEARRDLCSECAHVVFTVTNYTPPAAQPETWGSLKNRFREQVPTSGRP